MSLVLNVWGSYETKDTPIVVDVHPLDADGEERSVSVPMGSHFEVDVPPGLYLVEAVLPSGERLRRVADVPGPVVYLTPSSSPHEWLRFQHLLVPGGRLRGNRAGGSQDVARAPRVYRLDDWPTAWRGSGLIQLADERRTLEVDGARAVKEHAKDKDGVYLFEFGPRHGLGPMGAVVVDMGATMTAVRVAHWWDGGAGAEADSPFAVVVNAQQKCVSTTVEDRRFAPVLGYLAGGSGERAAVSLGQAPVDLLYAKETNPYAAAAGAYVLIDRLDDEARTPKWRNWIANLANWFPWLPDGAILEGRALLYENRPAEALRRFLEGFDRGVPLFGAGLRMLLEGLLSFSRDDVAAGDRERLAEATSTVRRWASWVDPREAFLTLCLPVPVHEIAS